MIVTCTGCGLPFGVADENAAAAAHPRCPRCDPAVPDAARPTAPTAGRSRAVGLLQGAAALLALVAVAVTVLAVALSRRASAAGPGEAIVGGVSSVLYETAAGAPVLLVRGELRAGTATLVAPAVEVEVLDDERVIVGARALAGAVPLPEEVYAVADAAGAERLAALLAVRARPRLEPGERARFGLVVPGVPRDARRLGVRVRVAP